MKYMCAVLVLMAGLCGCENSGNDTTGLGAKSTGVVPSLGRYSSSADIDFSVLSPNVAECSADGYAYYNVPIHDGGVSFSNGDYYWILNGEKVTMEDSSGNLYPTDGFAIWGQWTSPTHFEGTIFFGSGSAPFTANK